MKNPFIFALLIASAPSFAGSATALIDCKSDSGRTTVHVGDEDLGGALNSATLTVDGQSYVYDIEAHPSELFSIYDFKNKVITMTVVNRDTHRQFQMWAIPSSVKVTQGNATKGTFKAIVTGNDPRAEFDFLPQVTVNCTLDYSI